jgi:apolipoprotein N-acyltransferase
VGGGGLAAAVRAARPARLRPALAGLGTLALVPLLGLLLAWPLRPAADDAGRTITVAVVQGGLPDLALRFESRAEQVLDNHVRQTLRLAAQVRAGTVARPDLVIWPENSSDVDPFRDPGAYNKINSAVRAIGVPVLVGAILQGPGPTHRRNVGILWSPTTGPGAQYTKRHPVPFAEYIPLRSVSEWVSSYAKTVTQDMVAGHGDGLLRGGPVPIGDVICFEVAYDGLVRSSVAAGAQLLVVQTNNATFGHTAETYQQLAMAQLRAVETGRTVVQAATTGKSAVIGPDGGIRDESGALFTSAILVDTVPVRTATTLAVRVGAAPEYVLAVLAVLGVAGVVVGDRRARAPGPQRQPTTHDPEQEMVQA